MPTKLSASELQRKHWLKALGIARVMFEEDGYHVAYLDEIEAFINKHMDEARKQEQQPMPREEGPYHYDHYPNSRFWAAYAGKEMLAVTVYRKGAREVTARLEAKDRTIAELKRQIAALSAPHP